MKLRSHFIILITILLLVPLVSGVDNKVPKEGTIFVGEEKLDISDCDVRPGDEIAWWQSGSPGGIPDARAKVADIRQFAVDPKSFSSHTGMWYGLINQKPVFKVEDPWIQLDLVENGLDYEKEWVKHGSLVSFKISTNMADLSKRAGSAGVPVEITLTGPNNTVYETLDSPQGTFNLKNIFVYYSPYDTGAIWETKNTEKYQEGEYRASAKLLANNIYESNKVSGATYTDDIVFTMSKVKPEKKKEDKTETEDKIKKDSEEDEEEEEETAEPTDTPEKTKTPTPEPTEIPTEKPTPQPITEIPTQVAPEKPAPGVTISLDTKPAEGSSDKFPHPPKPTAKTQPLPGFLVTAALLAAILLANSRRN